MKKLSILILAAATIVAAASCKEDKNRVIQIYEAVKPSVAVPASSTKHHIFYEANPKVFGTTGQLAAIEQHYSMMNPFGFDVLWLMPIHPTGTVKSIGSPYCIKDYKAIRPEIGTMDEFSAFVSIYHAEPGKKIILDWVANHTAWDHPWVTEHPDWYTKDGQGNIVYPETWTDVADLNYSNNDLREAMIDAMAFWVNLGVDGFRCDYAHGVPDDFWTDAIARLRQIKPDLLMLAESDYERLYDDGFDVIFSRPLKAGLVDLFARRITPEAFMAERYASVVANIPDGKTKLFFTTNHDDASEISPVKQFPGETASISAFLLAAALNSSFLIYSSQEIGYPDKLNFFTSPVLDWTSNWEYSAKLNNAMSTFLGFDREGGFRSYVSPSALWIVYDNGYLAVNTTGERVKVQIPAEVPQSEDKDKRKTNIALEPYGYKLEWWPSGN